MMLKLLTEKKESIVRQNAEERASEPFLVYSLSARLEEEEEDICCMTNELRHIFPLVFCDSLLPKIVQRTIVIRKKVERGESRETQWSYQAYHSCTAL